jgi:hypothetical protein
MTSLRALLIGGDRRSQAQSARALALVRKRPARIAELARLTRARDWLVSMRALDLLEKLAHDDPGTVQTHRQVFIGPLADSDKWEIRLQVVRVLPLLRWTRRERARAVAILRRDVAHPQTFVKAWALDSLATFAEQDRSLRPAVLRALEAFEASDRKALQARARRIRERIASPGG